MLDILGLLREDQENIRQLSAGHISRPEFIEKEKVVLDKFKTHIDENGFPFKNIKGDGEYEAAIALTLHSGIDILEMVLDLLKGANPNQYDKKHLAYITDKMLVHEGRSQIYGTQFKRHDNGSIEFLPIEDMESIDVKREEMGLQSLDEYRKIAEGR